MLVTCVVCMCSSAMTVIVRTAVTAALNVAYLCSCVCVCVCTHGKRVSMLMTCVVCSRISFLTVIDLTVVTVALSCFACRQRAY
jgi:hypothetical protein